jgi:hypothetical protein
MMIGDRRRGGGRRRVAEAVVLAYGTGLVKPGG